MMDAETQARIEALEDRVVALEGREGLLVRAVEKLTNTTERMFNMLVAAGIVVRRP